MLKNNKNATIYYFQRRKEKIELSKKINVGSVPYSIIKDSIILLGFLSILDQFISLSYFSIVWVRLDSF